LAPDSSPPGKTSPLNTTSQEGRRKIIAILDPSVTHMAWGHSVAAVVIDAADQHGFGFGACDRVVVALLIEVGVRPCFAAFSSTANWSACTSTRTTGSLGVSGPCAGCRPPKLKLSLAKLCASISETPRQAVIGTSSAVMSKEYKEQCAVLPARWIRGGVASHPRSPAPHVNRPWSALAR